MSEITNKLLNILDKISDEIIKNEDILTDLDRKIGDGDHGLNMKRGFQAIKNEIQLLEEMNASDIFNKCAMTLITNVGGASGPLYGTAFMKIGMSLKNKTDEEIIKKENMFIAMTEAIKGIKDRGKADISEKTMLDVLIPAVEEFGKYKDTLSIKEIFQKMEIVAKEGLEYTKIIKATKGRASYLGERSIGVEDPGSYSSYIIIKTISENL